MYELKPEGFDEVEEGQFDKLNVSTRESWFIKVIVFMPGFAQARLLVADSEEVNVGLGSQDVQVHQEALYALYWVMCGWLRAPSMASSTYSRMQRLAPPNIPPLVELNEAEYAIAWHFIITYADFVRCAPLLPHRL